MKIELIILSFLLDLVVSDGPVLLQIVKEEVNVFGITFQVTSSVISLPFSCYFLQLLLP